MNHSQLHAFFVQIGLMLAVAWLFGYLMKRLAQPVVLGELIGGILLGPTLLGTVCPDAYATLFPIDKTIAASMDGLLKVGMLFFMSISVSANSPSLQPVYWVGRCRLRWVSVWFCYFQSCGDKMTVPCCSPCSWGQHCRFQPSL